MNARKWWRVSAVLAAIAASVAVVSPASTTQTPVIVSPAQGSEVEQGFAGPVRIDYSGVAPGTYHVEVRDAEGGGLYRDVLSDMSVVDGGTTFYSQRLLNAIDKAGRYRVTTWPDGTGPSITSTFTVPGGEPPTVLSPGRKVILGQPWTLKIDWSDTPIGYYDLDLYRAGYAGSCCDWWVEMFSNHEKRGIVTYQMDPITVKGKYYVRLGTWNTYFQVR